jgi:hypothetical protein
MEVGFICGEERSPEKRVFLMNMMTYCSAQKKISRSAKRENSRKV